MAANPQNLNPQLDRYGRDPRTPSEMLRNRSNYDRDSGYAPLYAAMMADIPRLSSGVGCTNLILAILLDSLGRARDKNEPRHEWTMPRKIQDWCQICRCDDRTFQRERDYMKSNGIAEVQVNTRREFSFRLKYRDWQALPDYAVWRKAHPVAPEPDQSEALAEDEPAAIVHGEVRITAKPATVHGGKTSREYPVKCGVASIRFSNPNPGIDLKYSAVVQAGKLLIIPEVVSARRKNKNADPLFSTRKGNPDDMDVRRSPNIRPSGSGSQTSTKSGKSPIAAAYCSIFDPILQKSGNPVLSGDSQSILKVIEAAGPMPADFVGEFLARHGRASRPISGPRVCASIVREARANWESGKVIGNQPGKDLQIPSGEHFADWWKGWESYRGTNRRTQAQETYNQVVTRSNEQACFECTKSYLESLSDKSKGYNPDTFLREQAADGFQARWPAAQGDKHEKRRRDVIAGLKWHEARERAAREKK